MELLGVALIIGFIVFMVKLVIKFSQESRKAIEKTKSDYEASLDHLEQNPQDPNARKNALEKGRIYYELLIFIQGKASQSGDYQAKITADIEARIAHLKSA